MKKLYKKEKKKNNKLQKGGNEDGDSDENINEDSSRDETRDRDRDRDEDKDEDRDKFYNDQKYYKFIRHSKNCDDLDNCTTNIKIYEKHTVDDRIVEYYTTKNIKSDLIFDTMCVKDKTNYDDEKIIIICMKVDGKIRGYLGFILKDDIKEVVIYFFCADKGFRSPIYNFFESIVKSYDYNTIIISLNTAENISDISNYLYNLHFIVDETVKDNRQIVLIKNIQ